MLSAEVANNRTARQFPAVQSPIPSSNLDFLRGFAAVYVVVNHVRGAFFVGGAAIVANTEGPALTLLDYIALALLRLTALGTEFVIMFFCVSGMAMAHAVATSGGVFSFYVRRIIRIWPTYIVAVIFAICVAWLMVSINPDNAIAAKASDLLALPRQLMILFYLDTKSSLTPQFWSLPYEVLFYIIAPFVLMSNKNIWITLTVSVFLTIYALIFVGIGINPSDNILVNFFLNSLFWFMCGAASYKIFHRVPKLPQPFFWLIAVALFFLVLGLKTLIGVSNAYSNFVMIVLTLLAVRNLPRRLASSTMFNFGHFSYSIYVFHYAIIALISFFSIETFNVEPGEIRNYLFWITIVPPTVLGCWILYFVAEKPSISWLAKSVRESRMLNAR